MIRKNTPLELELFLKLGLDFNFNCKAKGEERERVIRFNCNASVDIFLDQPTKLSFLSGFPQPIRSFSNKISVLNEV